MVGFSVQPAAGPLSDSDKRVLRSGAICCGIPALLLLLLGLVLLIVGVVFIVEGQQSKEFFSKGDRVGIPLTAFGVCLIISSAIFWTRTICLLVILKSSTESSLAAAPDTNLSKAACPRQEYGTYPTNEPSTPPPYEALMQK